MKADSEGVELYEANFEELVHELERLDQLFAVLPNKVENIGTILLPKYSAY